MLLIANENLATYLDINSASNSIVQETPEYDNINGGLGLGHLELLLVYMVWDIQQIQLNTRRRMRLQL